MNGKLPVLLLMLFLIRAHIIVGQSPAQLKALRAALASKQNETETTTEPSPQTTTTKDPRLTGDPRHDWVYDPNLPRELNGYNLSDYPFYTSIPDDITFKCDGRLDGYYASIPHHCQTDIQMMRLQRGRYPGHFDVWWKKSESSGSLRHDFLCANYTVFDQSQFICHFVNSVNCSNSETHYERNNELYVTTTTELPEYEDEYEEEAPRTKRPNRRRKGGRRGGRRRKARRRTTTTQAPDYYYDDYEEGAGETLAPEEELAAATEEEATPKPKRTKTTTTTTTAEAPKANVQKVRRPQPVLRPPKPLTQPPTAPPAEEDAQYDYAVDPVPLEELPVEETPQDVVNPHKASRGQTTGSRHQQVPEDAQGAAPVAEDGRRPAAPRPAARRPVQTAVSHPEEPSVDPSEHVPRRHSGNVDDLAESSAPAGTQRRQRVSAADRTRFRNTAEEAPPSLSLPEDPDAQAPQRPLRGHIRTEEAVVSPPLEGLSVARSPFRGSARPSDTHAGTAEVPARRLEIVSQPARQPLAGSADEESIAEEALPQRPVSRRTGPAPKARHHQPSATRVAIPPSEDADDVIVDAPINQQEPRQTLRRAGGSVPPRRRLQRALPSALPDDSYQPFQGTVDLEELEVAASKLSSSAILPDFHAVISGILSGVGPNPPPPPPPKNVTGNETESELQEPPSSDAFIVGSILSGIGAAPAKGSPAASAPRVSGKPKAKKPETPAEQEAASTSSKSPQQVATTKRLVATTEIPPETTKNNRVVKRRRKQQRTTTATTTTTTVAPIEEEYEYVE